MPGKNDNVCAIRYVAGCLLIVAALMGAMPLLADSSLSATEAVKPLVEANSPPSDTVAGTSPLRQPTADSAKVVAQKNGDAEEKAVPHTKKAKDSDSASELLKNAAVADDIDSDTAALTDSDASHTAVPTAVPEASPPLLKDEIPKEKMPDIKVTVTPQKGAIGDVIEWKVTVQKKTPQDRVVLPSSFDFGKLEIQARNVKEEHADEKSMTQITGISLIAFDTGEFKIPPQKLTAVDDKGNLTEVMTPAFTVTIDSLIANEPEPAIKADPKGGEVVMVDDYTILYIAVAVLAILVTVLLTLLVRKLLSLRKPKPGPPPPPPRPAHEVAFEKLNALKRSGYLDEQMHKTFHLKLSEAFREYLGSQYGFDALECSTLEIVAALRQLSLKMALHREVVQLLEDTDLVKFARYVPPKEESERLLDEAFRIVEITRSESPSTSLSNDEQQTEATGESAAGGSDASGEGGDR